MARLKPEVGKLQSLEEVNASLMEIGLLEGELEALDASAHAEIVAIKKQAEEDGKEKRKRIMELSNSIGAYAQYNRGELFKDKKSIELSFGKFGFRKTTSIAVKKTTIELLKEQKLKKYIRIKEEPNKELMEKLDDATLHSVDASRRVKDDFFCEANREEINKELLKKKSA